MFQRLRRSNGRRDRDVGAGGSRRAAGPDNYWGCRSGENAKTSSKQSKEDFLHLLDELVVKTAVEDDSLSDAEKNAVRLMDEARKAAEAAAAAMEKATEASKVAMAERRATRATN